MIRENQNIIQEKQRTFFCGSSELICKTQSKYYIKNKSKIMTNQYYDKKIDTIRDKGYSIIERIVRK